MSILDRLTTVCEQGAVVPPELLRDTIDRLEHLEAENTRLRQGLWDCAIASGFDHDGDLTPQHLAYPDIVDLALREVRQLRADYDETPPASDDKLDGGRDG